VTNPSKLKASSVKVVAPIPPGTAVQSAGGGTQVGSELQWPPVTLAAGDPWNGSYTVAVTAPAGAVPSEITGAAGQHEKAGSAPKTDPQVAPASSVLLEAPLGDGPDLGSESADAAAILISVIPAQQEIAAGGDATFEITVRNTGTVQLTDVAVTAKNGLATVSECESQVGILEPPDGVPNSKTYTCSVSKVSANFTLTVTATGNPSPGPNVSDTDIAIQISKATDSQQIFTGDTASFNITVTNNGDVALTGVAVRDRLAPGCDKDIGNLVKGAAAVSYPCTLANVKASFTNTATVTASSAVGALKPVDATATVSVVVPPVNTGACVTWRYPGDTADQIVCSNGTGGLPVFLPMVVR
jgi:uncharacterized repeat protein (TIGR01451 family)